MGFTEHHLRCESLHKYHQRTLEEETLNCPCQWKYFYDFSEEGQKNKADIRMNVNAAVKYKCNKVGWFLISDNFDISCFRRNWEILELTHVSCTTFAKYENKDNNTTTEKLFILLLLSKQNNLCFTYLLPWQLWIPEKFFPSYWSWPKLYSSGNLFFLLLYIPYLYN